MNTGFKLHLTRCTLFDSSMKQRGILLKIPRITPVDTPLIVPILVFCRFGIRQEMEASRKFQPTFSAREKDEFNMRK